MTHTPGPWLFGKTESGKADEVFEQKAPSKRIAQCSKQNCSTLETQANARLIAAAPDLLAALKALDPYLDAIVCYASTMGEHEPNRLVINARAAIAKAEGK